MPFCLLRFDEAEGDLPDVCLRCGARAVCRVPKTIRLHDVATGYGRIVFAAAWLLIDLIGHFSSQTLVLRGPFCAAHRHHWAFRRVLIWSLAGLIPILAIFFLGLYLAGAVSGTVGRGICGVSSVVFMLTAAFVYGTSTVKFGCDQGSQILTLSHVHPRFIEALERHREEKAARRQPPARSAASRKASAAAAAAAAAAAPPEAILVSATPPVEHTSFAGLDDARHERPRSRIRERPSNSNPQSALLIVALVGVPLILLVLLATCVGVGKLAQTALQRRAVPGDGPPRQEEEPREVDRDVEPGKVVRKAPAQQPPLPADLAERPGIDLIPLMVPRKDVVEGRWLATGGALHCDQGSFVPRVQFPYVPPEEYDFVVTFWQDHLRNGISLVMPNPNGRGSFFWFVGNHHGEGYGFHADPEKGGRIPKLVRAKTIHTTTVQVRKGSVRALLDGKELMRLQTDFRDLTCDDWRKIHDTRYLAVACDDPTVFYYVRLVEVTGKGKKGR